LASGTEREYYVWQPAGKPYTVEIAFDVIDGMNVEVMRGFGAVRRRGAEVGGLLVGRIEPTADHVLVVVEDFEPIPCEYAFGPSYILSPNDTQGLRKGLAQFDPSSGGELYTVGFYRSHTRDGLSLDDQDLKFFREYFTDPLHVMLLVKPFATKAGQAGIFIQENGILKTSSSYLEFPFRRRELIGEPEDQRDPRDAREAKDPMPAYEAPMPRPDRRRPESPAPSPSPAPTPPEPSYQFQREPAPAAAIVSAPIPIGPKLIPFTIPESEPMAPLLPPDLRLEREPIEEIRPMFGGYQQQQPSRWKGKLGWIVFSIMLVVFGAAVGYQYAPSWLPTRAVSSSADPYALKLNVQRNDDNLLVKWDRESLAVKQGWRGLLTITEGQDSKAVQMDSAQLQNGMVLYRHVAPEVRFKLEVFLKEERAVVETFVWRMGA
jgi:hypothetical protein